MSERSMRFRPRRPLALAVALSLVASGCSFFDDQVALSEMEIRAQAGDVTIIRDGARMVVDGVATLHEGDVIETGPDSAARLRLEGDRLAEMQADSRTVVVSPSTLQAEAGSLLADVSEPMVIRFQQVEVTTDEGVLRVDRGVATARTGVYKGIARMRSPGELSLQVGRFHEASTTANDIPSLGRPYQIDQTDPWDGVYLDAVLTVEEELERLSTGLTNQLGRRGPRLRYFRALAGRNVDFMKSFLDRPVADLIVGYTVAANSQSNLPTAFNRAFDLHDSGGSWGIVAAIMRVPGRQLLANLQDVIIGTGVVAEGGGGFAAFSAAAAEAASDNSSGPGGTDPGGGPQGPGEDPGDPGGPDPTPAPTCAPDDVECQVGEVVPTGLPTPFPT